MGCLFARFFNRSRHEDPMPEPPKQYSWDVRQKVDPKDYMLENLSNETVVKLPGSINGQQFIIQNCQGCTIFVLDHIATITVDDCTNCRIVLGPVKTSIFVRDCVECKLLVACQQFRSRDCRRMDICLFCVTQPIIESSTTMRFSCYQYHYPQLEEQFRNAGLSIFNNSWSNVHDFTPVADEKNFSLLPLDVSLSDYIAVPNSAVYNIAVTIDPADSTVPLTHGLRRKISNDSCFVVFFNDSQLTSRAVSFIRNLASLPETRCVLVQSKELQLQSTDAERIFGNESFSAAIQLGPVVGLEFNGDNVCKVCQETLVRLTKDRPGPFYVSPNAEVAAQQIDAFYSTATMMMAI